MNKREAGQSLVEMTFGLIVLLILLMGILDLGRLFYFLVALRNAAGEGAIYAAINPSCQTAADGPACADPDNVEYRVKHESPSGLVSWEQATVAVETPANATEGDPITVTVTYNYTLLTPFVQALVNGGVLPLRVVARQNILTEP